MNEQIQTAGAAIATKAAYTSSGGLIILGWYFEMKDLGILAGIVVGLATYFTNLYFRIRDDRRKDRADKRLAEWQRNNPGISVINHGENLD